MLAKAVCFYDAPLQGKSLFFLIQHVIITMLFRILKSIFSHNEYVYGQSSAGNSYCYYKFCINF
jgi:hypothetical protein